MSTTTTALLRLIFEAPPRCIPQRLHQSTIPPAVHEGSLFSTWSPTFVTSRLVEKSHSDRCALVSHGGFDFHLEKDIWSRVLTAA